MQVEFAITVIQETGEVKKHISLEFSGEADEANATTLLNAAFQIMDTAEDGFKQCHIFALLYLVPITEIPHCANKDPPSRHVA